jgi:succinate--hydroxymethylglutarate CoA-transferase
MSPTRFFKPLSNIRVLDLSRVLAGPYGTMLLGDLGADIIKVEHPVQWDETRTWGPPFIQEDSTYFYAANRNKKSIGLDFSKPHGKTVLGKLIQQSDVLVDNFVPGKLETLGITDEFVRATNPAIVWASISGYGPVGPNAQKPGYAVILEAFGGMMSITGPQSGDPVKLGVAWTDIITGLHTDIAILAALNQQPREFVHIDTSLLTSQISALANVATAYLISGVEAKRWGSEHASIVPYGTFECLDGHIAVAVGNERHFDAFCLALDMPDLAKDERFTANADRVQHRQAFHDEIYAKFKTKSREFWREKLENAGVPVSKVNTIKEVFADPQVQAVAGVIEGGGFKFPGYPFLFRGYEAGEPCALPPRRGQHTDNILRNIVGLSSEEIVLLRTLNIVA